jgi:hypothetical protein
MKLSAVIRELIAAGVSGDALVAAVERIEAAAAPVKASGAERQARYRARKAESDDVTSRDVTPVTEALPPLSSPPLSPQTPNNPPPIIPPNPDISRGLAVAKTGDGRFDEFWAAYPRRTGKEAARKAWCAARKRDVTADHIITAARRYAEHPPDDPTFIPHPATWLNGGRYDDEPMERTNNGNSMGRNNGAGTGSRGGAPLRGSRTMDFIRRVERELATDRSPHERDDAISGALELRVIG